MKKAILSQPRYDKIFGRYCVNVHLHKIINIYNLTWSAQRSASRGYKTIGSFSSMKRMERMSGARSEKNL